MQAVGHWDTSKIWAPLSLLLKPKGTDLQSQGGNFSVAFKGGLSLGLGGPVPITKCVLNSTH